MPRSAEVDEWFESYENPMKEVVMAMRERVLGVDPRVGECIKWKAPTFTFEGNIASFFPRSKKHASLMFHQGAKIPGRFPTLEGTGDTSRVFKVSSLEQLDELGPELEALVAAWIEWKGAGKSKKKTAKKTAKKR